MIGCRNCEQRPDGDCGAHGPPNAGRGAHVVGAVVPAPGLRDCQELPTIRLADALEAEVARLTAELAEARERGVAWAKEMQEPAACGHRKGVVSYPADGPPDCAPCRVEAAERRADAALLRANAADDRAEIARGDASDWRAGKRIAEAAHAAEREARAAAEKELEHRDLCDQAERDALAAKPYALGPCGCGGGVSHAEAVWRLARAEEDQRAAAEAREGRLREAAGIYLQWAETVGRLPHVLDASTRLAAALAQPADDSALRAHVSAAVRGAVERVVEAARKAHVEETSVGLVQRTAAEVLGAIEAAAKKETT